MEQSVLRQRARDLRKNSKFKRQVPIGEFIVDFVCLEKRLIIELDGGQHADNQMYDESVQIG
ncbi:endonuclease domain-containing protein [Fluoribacter gormanii]|nr:endonuclease domain-containing protein [Fluoribacter gormanii]